MKTTYPTRAAVFALLAAISPAAFSQDNGAITPKLVEKNSVKPGSLTATIADSATFSTLTKALTAAGLDITLGMKGEYTIFAPTDEAFGKLPAEVLAKIMLPENKEKLRSLLLYHVVAGKIPSSALKDGDVKTMNGEKIEVDVEADRTQVEKSKIFSADVMANNGVMHTIDKVLIPESLDGFAGLDK